jgi:outer membrane protein
MNNIILKYMPLLLLTVTLQAKDVYSVDELVEYALKNAPDLKITMKEVEASAKKSDQAFGYFLPKVDLHLSGGEIASSDVPANPDTMKQDRLLLGEIFLKQLIYDFGKSSGNYKSLNYLQDSSSMHNLQSISDKIRDVKTAYYNVLRSMALINVAQENLKLNEAQLYRAKRYFTAGIRTKIDISDAKVNVINAKIYLKQVYYKLKLAYSILDKIIGVKEIDSPYTILEQKLQMDAVFNTLLPFNMNLQESVEYAYSHRYSIKELNARLKASSQKTKVSQSKYYPSLYFSADYTRQELKELEAVLPKEQWQASLNLNWNLYEGGSSKADIAEKIIQESISQAKLELLKLQIKKDVTNEYLNLNESKDRVELSEALLDASKEKFTQAQKRYENGLSDYIELQQARQSYIDAKSSLVVDYYNYYDVLARLHNVIGM